MALGDPHPMMPHLYDFAVNKWVKLVEADMGIRVGRATANILFQDWNGGRPRIVRFRLRDHKVEGLLSFGQIDGPLAGTITGWSGIAPDDSLLIARDIGHHEIYALHIWPR